MFEFDIDDKPSPAVIDSPCTPILITIERYTTSVQIKNVSGAGDSLIAGFVHGFINNLDWDYTNKLAMSLSALNLKSDNCVNEIINNEILNTFIKENNFD